MLRLVTNQSMLDITSRNRHNRDMNQFSRDLIHLKEKMPRTAANWVLGRVLADGEHQSGVE